MAADNPQENGDPVTGERQSDNDSSHTKPKVTAAGTEFKPPIPASQNHKTCKERKHWLDYATFGAEILGLLGLGIYAYLTYGIWCANKTATQQMTAQTTLLGKQLEATQGAVIKLERTPDLNGPGILIRIKNEGQTIAHGVVLEFQLSKRQLPTETPIGSPIPWNVPIGEVPPVPPNLQNTGNDHLDFSYERVLDDADIQKLTNTEETLGLEGQISYNNGFREIHEPVCYSYLAYTLKSKSGKFLGSSSGFQPCPDFDSSVTEKLRMIREAASKD